MQRRPLSRILLLCGLCAVLAAPADAQRLQQYARASVESPHVLARGGAVVAWPSAETALFYNPAQLARLDLRRPQVDMLSVQGGVSANFLGNLGFLRTDVRDAAEEGFGYPLSAREVELFEEALDRGRYPTVGQAAAALPVVTFTAGSVGVSGGMFGTNTTRLRFEDIGGGIPLLDFWSQVDVIAAGGAGLVIPQTPLAAGATVRVARRYLASKRKDLLSVDTDEQLYVFAGTTLAVDLGLHAADLLPSIPGQLDLGLALYDLVGGSFAYELDRSFAFSGEGDVDQREVDAILASLEGRDGKIAVRAGAAYHPPQPLGPLADITVGIDWFSAPTSESRQPALAGLRLGAEASLGPMLSLRAGLGQGYPSGGFGLRLPLIQLDYSLYGVEEGRLPGQMQRYDHLVRVRFSIR